MGSHKYEFRSFCDQTYAATQKAWSGDAKLGLAFPTDVERLFHWVSEHRQPAEQDATAFGVFNEGDFVALGIAEVVIQRLSARSKWVKLLRLHLRPEVDAALQQGEVEIAMDVFTTSVLGSFRLQMAHDAATLKIYGRTNDQLRFLRTLVAVLNQTESKFKASLEGRFLCLQQVT